MVFTVELKTRKTARFRLQTDGTWRKLTTDFKLRPTDYYTADPSEVIRRSKPSETTVVLEDDTYRISPSISSISDTNIAYNSSTVFRRTFPLMPSKEQLRHVIATGDDTKNNSLILNVYGQFELRQQPEYDIRQNDPTVVLRHETFCTGNDYVGPDAAQDNDHIDAHYFTSLQHWINHLGSGSTRKYSDLHMFGTVAEIEAELTSIEHQWTSEY